MVGFVVRAAGGCRAAALCVPPCSCAAGFPCVGAPAGRSLNSQRSDNATGLPLPAPRRRRATEVGENPPYQADQTGYLGINDSHQALGIVPEKH